MKNSSFWSGLASSLSPYVPGEQPGDGKIVKLNTNENPYPPSPKALEAIIKTANEKLKLYPDPSCTALRRAIALRWNIKPEQVFCGNGSDEILAFAFASFFESAAKYSDSVGKRPDEAGRAGVSVQTGLQSNRDARLTGPAKQCSWDTSLQPEPILFPNITYSFYPVYAALWNIPFETPPLKEDFSINTEDYKKPSGGVIFPNPNAPTGRILDRDALSEIVYALVKNKKVFILDEAYIAFADKPETGSMIPLIENHPNLLVVRTLSKEASLAGLRSGFAVGSEELIEGLCRIRDSFNSYTVDRLAQAASLEAINDAVYYNEVNERIRKTRNRTAEALNAIGFKVIPSQANFILASPPPSSPTASEWLGALRERGILVRHFKQREIENYLRVSIGTDDDMDFFLKTCGEILRGKQ